MHKTQKGFVGIILVIIIAIAIGMGGTYWYLKKDLITQPEIDIQVQVATSTNSSTTTTYTIQNSPTYKPASNTGNDYNLPLTPDTINVVDDGEIYVSNNLGVQFNYPEGWYIHENPKHIADAPAKALLVSKHKTLPVPGMDGDIYGLAMYVTVIPLSTNENNMTEQQHLAGIQADHDSSNDIEIRKAGLNPQARFFTINNVRVIEEPWFSDLDGIAKVNYYMYKNGKVYKFSTSQPYTDKENLYVLWEIIASFKII